MSVKLLTEHRLESLGLTGFCTGSSESALLNVPHVGNHVSWLIFFHFRQSYSSIYIPHSSSIMLFRIIWYHIVIQYVKKRFLLWTNILSHNFQRTVRAVYPGIYCNRIIAQSRIFVENSIASLHPQESGLECKILINGYDYQNKEKKAPYPHKKVFHFILSVFQN